MLNPMAPVAQKNRKSTLFVLMGSVAVLSFVGGFAPIAANATGAETERLLAAPITAASPPPAAPVVNATPMVAGAAEIASLREENARLTRAMAEQRQAFENAQATTGSAALNELRQKLDSAVTENEKLKRMVEQQAKPVTSPPSPAVPDLSGKVNALTNDLQKATASLTALQNENTGLKAQLAQQQKAQAQLANANTTANTTQQKIAETLAALQAENASLKTQIESYKTQQASLSQNSAGQSATIKATADKLATVHAENETLKKQIQTLTANLQAKPQTVTVEKAVVSPEMQKNIDRLTAENTQLKALLAKPPAPVQPSVQQAVCDTKEDDALRSELRSARVEKDTALSEKAALQTQIEQLRREANTSQLRQSGGSWDLEQATRRYQESQREIQRLGALLQTQQTKCVSEKKEIEGMLFDPAIAEGAQISMVNSLKEEIAQKDAKIKALESSGGAASSDPLLPPLPESVEIKALRDEVVFLKQQLSSTKAIMQQNANAKTSLQAASAQNLEIATLKGQLEQSQQRITSLQNQLGNQKPSAVTAAGGSLAMVPPVAPPVPLVESGVVKTATVSPVIKPKDIQFTSIGDFTMLLKSAGVPLRGGLKQIEGGDASTYRAYSWKTSSLFGSAELRYAPDTDAFGDVIKDYLDRAKKRCSGEFAAIPSDTRAENVTMSKSYEIACVSNNTSSSASVLFAYANGVATTISHEGRAEAMEMAMDARDKMAETLKK